jgi:hypothetical protein
MERAQYERITKKSKKARVDNEDWFCPQLGRADRYNEALAKPYLQQVH